MDFSAVTKLPPKQLALIAAGGIGAGLLWRHYSNKKAAASGGTTTAGTVDTSKLALAQNSAGNLGAAGTQQVSSVNDATRDVGQGYIPIPVSKWVVIGQNGVAYYADANGIIGPVNTTSPTSGGSTTGQPLGDGTSTGSLAGGSVPNSPAYGNGTSGF